MACRRQAVTEKKGAEETMQNLLDISRDSVRQERRRSWKRLAAVLVLLVVTAAVVAYTKIVVPEDGYYSIVLKETVNGRNYVYVEDRGHLIRLKCGKDVDFDAITLRDEWGDTISYQMDYQWNRLTRTGTVSACEDTGATVLGSVMDVTYEGIPAACRFSSVIPASSISGTATTRTPTQSQKIWCSYVTSGIGPMIRRSRTPPASTPGQSWK